MLNWRIFTGTKYEPCHPCLWCGTTSARIWLSNKMAALHSACDWPRLVWIGLGENHCNYHRFAIYHLTPKKMTKCRNSLLTWLRLIQDFLINLFGVLHSGQTSNSVEREWNGRALSSTLALLWQSGTARVYRRSFGSCLEFYETLWVYIFTMGHNAIK